MTESLPRAFDAASQLPESEQDAIATWLLAEWESERKWSDLFATSQDHLASLAKEALDEPSRGETRELDEDVVRHKPSKDRWSICEVIGHLVDSACNNHQRFVRAQEGDALAFPKYDQNAWVIAGDYNQSEWPSLVALWYSYNQHLAQIIRRIPATQLNTPCTITPNETCTFAYLIDDYLFHLQHHLDKIKERIDAQK